MMKLDLSTPRVMTIINATLDSFFSGSRTPNEASLAVRVEKALTDGADILDVGGYSSRPGAVDISFDEEISRVTMALKVIRTVSSDVIISLDTFRSEVARASLDEFGEMIINDISGGALDDNMYSVVAKYNVPYIAMHMRGTPQTMTQLTQYDDIVDDVCLYFEQKIKKMKRAGLRDIILDPGFGFAKDLEQNYKLLAGMDIIKKFRLPILVGLSRKSMVFKALDITPDQALNGTTALHWQALLKGANILRVHDTLEAKQVVKLFNLYDGINSNK